jgi:hypothetical protein
MIPRRRRRRRRRKHYRKVTGNTMAKKTSCKE